MSYSHQTYVIRCHIVLLDESIIFIRYIYIKPCYYDDYYAKE